MTNQYIQNSKRIYFSFLSFFLFQIAISQTNYSASNILHQLEAVPVCASVLYVAAHPDDENTRLISYLTNEQHYRTAYLSLTRGDGGQNLIGNEQSEQMGLIRTNELLAARKVDGGEQFFSRAFDFGFSKNPDETFRFWDREKVLADAVWVIRSFRPDVIICRFPTTGEGGHGHHTASAIIAEEAFAAAADAKRFPEQLKYVQTWHAKRLLWNTFNFGNTNTTSASQFKIDVGGFNTLLGKSYGEIAAESRSCHSSQAFGTARNRANQTEFFKTIKGNESKESLMDEVNTSMQRFANKTIEDKTQEIIRLFNIKKPFESVPALVNLYKQIEALSNADKVLKEYKLKQLQQLIIQCSGIYAEAICAKQYIALGDTISVSSNIINRAPGVVKLKSVSVNGKAFTYDSTLLAGTQFSLAEVISVQDALNVSQPYWLETKTQKGMFVVNDQLLIGKPQNDGSLFTEIKVEISGKIFDLKLPIQYKKVDPAKGEIYQPLYIAPPATVSFLKEVYVLPNGNKKKVEVKVKAFKKNISGSIVLELPGGWKTIPAASTFNLTNEGDEQLLAFEIEAPAKRKADTTYTIGASLNINNKTYRNSFVEIKYDHVPVLPLFTAATCKLTDVALQNTVKNIGYISGAGDKLPAMLTEMGLTVSDVSDEDILQKRLQKFDAIVIGVRAYNTETSLKNNQAALMEYVKNGGRLLVQYNTNQKLVSDNLGPYPFKLSRDRVTEEDAHVTFLDAASPLLNAPNKITAKDFDGWIQERGLYFPADVDSSYKKLLSMNDTGEKPLENSVIYTNYGTGRYVYTGLSFFRELPAGVPGAFKLFANFIAK
jgi:LmbE family N-acetylglucosaminyl deacetylase